MRELTGLMEVVVAGAALLRRDGDDGWFAVLHGELTCERSISRSAPSRRPTALRASLRRDQKLQQITLSASLTMIELPVMAGCAHSADSAI
jgi:hypothetical protein